MVVVPCYFPSCLVYCPRASSNVSNDIMAHCVVDQVIGLTYPDGMETPFRVIKSLPTSSNINMSNIKLLPYHSNLSKLLMNYVYLHKAVAIIAQVDCLHSIIFKFSVAIALSPSTVLLPILTAYLLLLQSLPINDWLLTLSFLSAVATAIAAC